MEFVMKYIHEIDKQNNKEIFKICSETKEEQKLLQEECKRLVKEFAYEKFENL